MKTLLTTTMAALTCLALAGCQQEKPAPAATTTTSNSAPAKATDDGHDHAANDGHDHAEHEGHNHGEARRLGTVEVGATSASIDVSGAIEAGGEVHLELALAEGKPTPKALRVWIGSEDAAQTGKALVEVDSHGHGHTHVEVPKPLDPTHRLWVEAEDAAGKKERVSVGLAP